MACASAGEEGGREGRGQDSQLVGQADVGFLLEEDRLRLHGITALLPIQSYLVFGLGHVLFQPLEFSHQKCGQSFPGKRK